MSHSCWSHTMTTFLKASIINAYLLIGQRSIRYMEWKYTSAVVHHPRPVLQSRGGFLSYKKNINTVRKQVITDGWESQKL